MMPIKGKATKQQRQGLVAALFLLLFPSSGTKFGVCPGGVSAFWIQRATTARKILFWVPSPSSRCPESSNTILFQSMNNEYLQSLSSSLSANGGGASATPTAHSGRAGQDEEALIQTTTSRHQAVAAHQGNDAETSKFLVTNSPRLDTQRHQEDGLVLELQQLTNTLQAWTARNGQTVEENETIRPMHSPNSDADPSKTTINGASSKGKGRLYRATSDVSVGELVQRATEALVDFGQVIMDLLQFLSQTKPGGQIEESISSTRERVSSVISEAVSSIQETRQDIANLTVGQVCQRVIDVMRAAVKSTWEALGLLIYVTSHKDVAEWKNAATQRWQDARERLVSTANDISQKSVYDLIVMLGKFELDVIKAVPKTANKAWKFMVTSFARNK